jgi:autotransporter-associated beta strand protein
MTVSNGAIVFFSKGNNNQAVGANLIINNATVNGYYSNQFLPTTNVDISGNGLLALSTGERANNISFNGGTIQLQGAPFVVAGSISSTGGGAAFSNYGTLDLNGAAHVVSVANPGLANALTINVDVANGTINKTGSGVLNLYSTNNTFAGQNIVSAGALRGPAGGIGNNVLNNANVEIYNGAYSGNISGPGTVNITGYVQYLTPQGYGGGTFIDTFGTLDGTTATLLGNITGIGSQAAISLNQAGNGTLTAALAGQLDLQKNNTGIITINTPNAHTGSTNINDGGLIVGASNALGTGTVSFGSYPNTVTLESTAPVNLPNPLSFSGSLTVQGGGNINVTSATNKNTNNTLTHNSTGTTTIDGKFNVGTTGLVVVNSGALVLGNPAAVGGFTSQGQVVVNGGTLTVRSLNFVTLPDVALAGGTLNAPNGYAIPLGAALQGYGAVTGRVSSANGSTILAAGNLGIGDPSHPAGVNLDGELYTDQYSVTLNDSNQAVLGSLTHLGNGPGVPGALISPNGLVLNFGRNITGNGAINSTNALARAVIANGDVNGDSFADPITFSGYVKGVGTFNNTIFGGTFAPGLSPALLTVGDIGFASTNVFEEEIGGLNRGSQYDAIDANSIYLDGQLKVVLINGFNPVAGNSFDLFNGVEFGAFSSYNLAPLSPGLTWDTSQLYSQGKLNVVAVPEPAALALAGVGVAVAAVIAWGRRRRGNACGKCH